ncbi:MAG: hypothetical protein ACI4F7_09335 [Acutalibacteraceae bacterium]
MNKKADAEKLFRAFELLDDVILDEAFEADSRQNPKKLVKVEKKPVLTFYPTVKRVAAVFLCVSVTVLSASTVRKLEGLDGHTVAPAGEGSSYEQSSSYSNPDVGSKPSSPKPPDSGDSSSPQNTDGQTSSAPSYTDNNSSAPSEGSLGSDNSGVSDGSDVSSGSESTAPDDEFKISSLDMLNYYTAKKILEDKSLLPTAGGGKPTVVPLADSRSASILNLSDNLIQYAVIDRNTEFTVTMVTYFTLILLDENGFLAQKLGGTGLVEVVITENNFENMLTFKRGNRYYSCLLDYETELPAPNLKVCHFTTHKYISGFNIMKNFNQDAYYMFDIKYDGLKVIDFRCSSSIGDAARPIVDSIKFIDDLCVVVFTNQSFTIAGLEGSFKKESA